MIPRRLEEACIAVAIATVDLVAWLRPSWSDAYERRLGAMMSRVGLNAGTFEIDETNAYLIEAARKQCRHCSAQDSCQLWLSGELEGDNDFCPNKPIFSGIAMRERLKRERAERSMSK